MNMNGDVVGDGGSDVNVGDGSGDASDAPTGDVTGGTTMRLEIWEGRPGRTRVPIAAARVLFDHPDGHREETMTDAMGRASIANVDFSRGTASATVYKPGFVLMSRTGLTAADADIHAPLPVRDPRRIVMSGMITGRMDPMNNVFLSGNVAAAQTGLTTMYMLNVLADQPLTLYGLEFARGTDMVSARGFSLVSRRWFRVMRPAMSADTMFDLDVSMTSAMMPTSTRQTLAMVPMTSPLAAMGTGNATVIYLDGAGSLVTGASLHGDVSADGRSFELQTEHVPAPGMAGTFTRYTIARGDLNTTVLRPGVPENNANITGFFDVPVVTTPAAGAQHVITSPVTVASVPTEAIFGIDVLSGDNFVWEIQAARSATTITPPALPSNLDPADLGRTTLRMMAFFCERPTDPNDPCMRSSVSARWFAMRP